MTSEEKKTRFTDSSEEDLRRLVEASIPKNTKEATFWIGVLNDFCEEKNIKIDLQTCSAAELNNLLCRFYRRAAIEKAKTTLTLVS